MHRHDTPKSFTLDVHAGPRSIVVEEPAGSQNLGLVRVAETEIPQLRCVLLLADTCTVCCTGYGAGAHAWI